MSGRICVGDRVYALRLRDQGGQWSAEARDADSGAPIGPPVVGASESEAVDRLARWLAWQQAHAAALERLQDAERTYHRAVTGNAFGSAEMSDLQRDALLQLEEARRALDAVRGDQPPA